MRIKELDGLRGLAVIAVLNDHYLSWFPALGARFGCLGVDLFFVLSGFLITSILLELRNEKRYFAVFYSRRALRILPPYFLGLAVYMAASAAAGTPGSSKLWASYIFYYSSLINARPLYLSGAVRVPVIVAFGLMVLWSLSVEELYYTVWAPLIRFAGRRAFSTILLLMIVAAPLIRWIFYSPDHQIIYTFYGRMDGLAYGSAVALIFSQHQKFSGRWLQWERWIDRAALVVAPVSAIFWLVSRGRLTVLVCSAGIMLADLSFALILCTLLRRAGGEQFWVRILRMRPLRSVGMVSYSLYLFHYPLKIASADFLRNMHLSRRVYAVSADLLGLALSFGVAYGLWYGMESRILRWKDRKIPSPAHLKACQPVAQVEL